jgi:Fe-S cluster assembly protein SufD
MMHQLTLPAALTNEPSWLRDSRIAAQKRFNLTGIPTRKQESWKYTSLQVLANDFQHELALPTSLPTISNRSYALSDTILWQQINGQAATTPETLPAGVTLLNLSTALLQTPERVRALYQENTGNNVVLDYNHALLNGGYYLHVSAGTVLSQPIHIVHYSVGEQRGNHLLTLIDIEKNAELTLIEHFVGCHEETYLLTQQSQCQVAAGAQFNHYKLIEESSQATHLSFMSLHQQASSLVRSEVYSLSGGLIRSDSDVSLQASTEVSLRGLMLGKDEQHVDHHTVIRHEASDAKSHQYYKCILNDEARGVFCGNVRVAPGAVKTEANQQNKNLLISTKAQMNTQPQLEIFADDVRCSHGATVGQLDAEALFYLQSRGLSPAQAKTLLSQAFTREIIDGIVPTALKNYIQTYSDRWSEQL